MIRVGYVKKDGTEVVHETVIGAVNARNSIDALKASKSGDSSIDCFYLESQLTDTDWDRYAFRDQD
tara:strand:+ start:1461 stop:1658 length:198 start_codon:yes stop_codon:yes gene_type:complete